MVSTYELIVLLVDRGKVWNAEKAEKINEKFVFSWNELGKRIRLTFRMARGSIWALFPDLRRRRWGCRWPTGGRRGGSSPMRGSPRSRWRRNESKTCCVKKFHQLSSRPNTKMGTAFKVSRTICSFLLNYIIVLLDTNCLVQYFRNLIDWPICQMASVLVI